MNIFTLIITPACQFDGKPTGEASEAVGQTEKPWITIDKIIIIIIKEVI